MYCLACTYHLQSLSSHVCPECGRPFDPDDPASYARSRFQVNDERRARRLEICTIGLSLIPLIANGFALFALVLARLSLGRWPHRTGGDDPYGIDGLWVFDDLPLYILTLAFPTALLALVLCCFIAGHRAWRRLGRGFGLGVTLWLCGAGLFIWDPSGAWSWLSD